MKKLKIKNKKLKIHIKNVKIFMFLIYVFYFWSFIFNFPCLAQGTDDLEVTLDVNAATIPTPKIYSPNIDLSGRGFNRELNWPQTLAAKEALETWQKDIGFGGLYRIQYNFWEMQQLYKTPELQNKLYHNYEDIIRKISESGGIVILDLFGTPAGLGKVLDKKSPPRDLKAFKQLVKSTIRDLSCNKRYNIWYEVWNAPDLDDFFLGRKPEYFNLYRVVAESINELKQETRIYIPIGAPSVSWWFQNLDGNTIVSPENSLIYELIKFCYGNRLPLDFITWHGYSTDPQAEKDNTIYRKTSIKLIRDWLSYFRYDKNTLLIVDEWNFDRTANVLPQRHENSYIAASYIPSRIKNMHEAGIDYQLYFCLEDFQNNKEGVTRNVGIFSFDTKHAQYKSIPKATYNVFRMLAGLKNNMLAAKLVDEFAGLIATKNEEEIALVLYNYIDPEIVTNYLSKNIANLKAGERKTLLNIIKSNRLEDILLGKLEISRLRATNRVKALLKKTLELNERAKKFEARPRNLKINIKNLKGDFRYQKFTVDSSCSLNCEFKPAEEKEVCINETYQEQLVLLPYSVEMIILTKKPKEPEAAVKPPEEAAPDTALAPQDNATPPDTNTETIKEPIKENK